MNGATFDYKNSEIMFDHYSGMLLIITTVEDLVDHLNEEVISTMDGTMSLEWLRKQNGLDYDTEAREFLLEHYKKEIKKLKWNINDL